MRKLKIYRVIVFYGRAIWLVTLSSFSTVNATTSQSSAYFYHPDSSSLGEYYNLASDSPIIFPHATEINTPEPSLTPTENPSENSSTPSPETTEPQTATPPVTPKQSKFTSPFRTSSEHLSSPPSITPPVQPAPIPSTPPPVSTPVYPSSPSPSVSTPVYPSMTPAPALPEPLPPQLIPESPSNPPNVLQPAPPLPTERPPPQYIPRTQSQPQVIRPPASETSVNPFEQQPFSTTILPTLPLDPSSGPLNAASTLPMTPESVAKETYIINYNNINIVEFIRFISQISNTNFYFQEADLQFNVTIVSEEPANIDEIMSALIQILRIHGFELMEQGNNLVIYRNADVSRIAPIITDENQPINVPIITRVIRLNYIGPEKVKTIIQPMLSKQALIEVSPETRHLIITDITTNIDKILRLLQTLDIPHNSIEVATYFTQYSAAANLIGLAERILTPLAMADQAPITLVPQQATNTIFIVSTPDLINRTISILEALDKPTPPENEIYSRSSAIEISSYVAQNMPPAALIPLAEKILNPIAIAENILLTLVQQPSTNTIFIISTPELIQRALAVFRSIDQGTPPPSPELPPPPPPYIPSTEMEGTILYLYKLQFLKGERIEIALQDIGSSLAKSGLANADLVSTINSMQWLEPNNSLLFVGTPASIEKVKEFLRALDRPLRQVFLEVLVLQTSLQNSMNFGVQWGTNGISGQTFFGNSGLFDQFNLFSPNFVFPQVNNIPGIVQPSLQLQQGFNFGVIGDFLTHNGNVFASIGALVKALQQELQTKVLINPKIVTEDNNTAQIFVGQNIPYTTANVQIQAANNSTGFNIDYRDVGILLEITPYMGSSDVVTLDLHQEINNVDTTNTNSNTFPTTPNTISGFPIPTTNKILTTTRVHVPHNYFLMISGQISDQKTYQRAGLPCLGCLPVVGAAFSQQVTNETKQNLIIIIHPKIIDTRCDIASLTDEQGCDYARHTEAHYQGHKTHCGRYLCEPPCYEPPLHPPPQYPIGYCPLPEIYPDYPCSYPYYDPAYQFSAPSGAFPVNTPPPPGSYPLNALPPGSYPANTPPGIPINPPVPGVPVTMLPNINMPPPGIPVAPLPGNYPVNIPSGTYPINAVPAGSYPANPPGIPISPPPPGVPVTNLPNVYPVNFPQGTYPPNTPPTGSYPVNLPPGTYPLNAPPAGSYPVSAPPPPDVINPLPSNYPVNTSSGSYPVPPPNYPTGSPYPASPTYNGPSAPPAYYYPKP